MSIKTIQDILPLVEQPSRYLGTEINAIKKDLNAVQLRIALAFPDMYEKAIEWYSKGLDERSPDVVFLGRSEAREIDSDPRYQELLHRLNKPR